MYETIFKVKRGYNYFLKTTKGKSPKIVFVHGLGANCTQWQKSQEYFEKKGIATIAIDLLGCGNSDKPIDRNAYKFPELAKDILEMTDNKPIVLVAHSMGALPSLIIANKNPEIVKALILFEPVYGSLKRITSIPLNKLEPILDYLIPIFEKHTKKTQKNNEPFMPDAAHHKLKELIATLETSPPVVQLECIKEMMEWKPDFKGLSEEMPILVVGGGKDFLVKEEGLSKLVGKIRFIKYIKLEDAEHTLIIDEPDMVTELIQEMYELI